MESRRSYRLELAGELSLSHDLQSSQGRLINVGLTGIMASTNVPLEPGTKYLVSFQLKPGRGIFKSWSAVAWCQEHDNMTYLVGMQFEQTASDMHRMLADYISNRWINEHLSPGSYR